MARKTTNKNFNSLCKLRSFTTTFKNIGSNMEFMVFKTQLIQRFFVCLLKPFFQMHQIKLTFTTHGSIEIKKKTTPECKIQIYVIFFKRKCEWKIILNSHSYWVNISNKITIRSR